MKEYYIRMLYLKAKEKELYKCCSDLQNENFMRNLDVRFFKHNKIERNKLNY